ncbi:MAG: YciI family protein [Acidimicrobiia bacterium]
MTQYMLSVHMSVGADAPTEDELQQSFEDVDALNAEMIAAGAWVFAGGLHPAESATVVRADRSGTILTTDGPFAESKEQLGGFWIIEATHLDAALAWARKATVACRGAIEVRPFQDEPER